MQFEEYKKIFEEILTYTEETVKLYKQKKIEEAEVLFNKRTSLMAKLTPFEDIDEEKVNYIISLRNKIQELDNVLSQYISKQKEELKNKQKEEDNPPPPQLKDSNITNSNEPYNPKYNLNASSNVTNSIFNFNNKK